MSFPKKSLGQNFLTDKNIIKKIINLVKVKNKNIVEIGPGKGALTSEIIRQKPKSLIIIEKDEKLAKELKKKYQKDKSIIVITSDILNYNLEKKIFNNSIVFGNLPYNISSQILVKLLKFKNWPPKFSALIFMFQKELAQKIIGKYPSKNYGRISILTNFRLKLINKFIVSKNCFRPIPKVTSQVIHFQPRKKLAFSIKNLSNLEKITQIFFSSKRKMIKKRIKSILNEEQIKKIEGIDLSFRPSDLKPDMYYYITELYEKN